MDNLELWNSVEKTPESQTKQITGKSYKGVSPNPHYLIQKATETFGPCGIGWGFSFTQEIEAGTGEDKLHIANVKVWYKWKGERGEIEHVGQTMLCGKRNSGNLYTDEDAPKKSVTDGLIKALSMIGFAGDIFIGRYDDNKYVQALVEEERQEKQQPSPPPVAIKPATEQEFSAQKEAVKKAVKDIHTTSNLLNWIKMALPVWREKGFDKEQRAELSAIANERNGELGQEAAE